jgi:hypothetical protein
VKCWLQVVFARFGRLPYACRMSQLQQQLAAAKQEAATAHSWRQRCQSMRMQVDDLDAANARAMLRRHELVASYWPVMARLNLAEDAVAALTQQVGLHTAGGPLAGFCTSMLLHACRFCILVW